MDVNERYSKNNLISGPLQDSVRPLIAPLWDDLRLEDTLSIKYLTTGTAPNRKFTVEWGNVLWDYNSLETSVAFQMILFEGSNKIQFVYQPLHGIVSNASASIGIATCSKCTGSFLSVNDLSLNASISGTKEFKEINTKPVSGLSFEFTPGSCLLPAVPTVDAYNTKMVSFSWNSTTPAYFDYIVSTSEVQPENFITTTVKSAIVDNLKSGTQYYVYIRTACALSSKSGWESIPFKTASETQLPYQEKFEGLATPNLPENIAAANPTGGIGWKTVALSNLPPYNNAISFKGDNVQTADAWLVLPAMQLEGGTSYRLKFKYRSTDTINGNQKVEVRIGTLINTGMTGWQVIYKNFKISQTSFKDTSFLFAAPADETYFLAFRCVSDISNTALLLDDIEMDKVKTMSVKLISLTGIKSNDINTIKWRTSAEIRNQSFELQRSADGINFSSIGTLPTKAINGTSNFALDYSLNDAAVNLVDYYRLKIIDLDKNEFYSQIIKLSGTMPLKITVNKIFPNPATSLATTVFYSPYNAKARFKISDSYGKIILDIPINIVLGDNIIRTDISRFGNGVYFSKVVCNIGGETEGKMFIKQ
jgi:hypothetical protein